jgi:hypothetical protein
VHALRVLRNRRRQLDRAPAAKGGRPRRWHSTAAGRAAACRSLRRGICRIGVARPGCLDPRRGRFLPGVRYPPAVAGTPLHGSRSGDRLHRG